MLNNKLRIGYKNFVMHSYLINSFIDYHEINRSIYLMRYKQRMKITKIGKTDVSTGSLK